MFCLYFQEGPVRNLQEAMGSDRARFGKFFHGCLEDGVYFAPSQFEAGFLCTAHSAADIEKTADVVKKNLARVF
jgi:glutamate-1-semialdehyde 2,1-aminomutase